MILQVENPVVEVHDLTVAYQKKPVLWSIDFTLPAGNIIGIIGPNGAGKSTLLKAIMGIIPLASGQIRLWNFPIKDVRKRVSYVPQRESVDWDFPASVKEVVLMGRYPKLSLFQRPTKKDHEIVKQCLAQVEMLEYENRQIGQLSGGQQQRVFLARALAQEAELYFMDEPFAGVDMASEAAIIKLLHQMRAQGKTIVVVHHDLQTAYEYFDWILLINQRLIASGPKEKIFTPELLQATYGGKLTTLTKIGELLKKKSFSSRKDG
ncbi:MAG: metal ABC transporter ATP-binding protein [Bacteroidia bacterium]|nr:metal ABC transporter ATP-binding protein [Bacteroidia bacterium]MDW8158983.1 metal ABC transporter ATP-binding protein [Bacteroidia bacterium]